MTENEALIALNMMPGIGSVTVLRIMERFGSAGAIFDLSEEDLASVQGVGPGRAAKLVAELGCIPYMEEIERAANSSVKLVTLVDDDYPELLKEISDPPPALYVAGDTKVLNKTGCAIIGTRHASVYGRETARRFGYQLASAGYSVISGFARGIDTEAHTGAVQASGVTIAVLGSALDKMYPQENKKFAREVIEKGGAIITEYPFGRSADRQTFPQRNRIVSGMSRGILVIESPLRSGTLITVSLALEQGRVVMVVPGRIDSRVSMGSNRLIREGARLVTSVDDVLEELQDLFAGVRREESGLRTAGKERTSWTDKKEGDVQPRELKLSAEERNVFANILDEGSYADTIVRDSGLETGKVNAILVSLQIKRLIKVYSGGIFKRVN
ncbi:MAG: DNA-processing protein DprA [Kiritimatiellae bacterium]|jgi:DNA processing protein|nr:DNA-processing protein DprA [Kiritimatiellia bacterium]